MFVIRYGLVTWNYTFTSDCVWDNFIKITFINDSRDLTAHYIKKIVKVKWLFGNLYIPFFFVLEYSTTLECSTIESMVAIQFIDFFNLLYNFRFSPSDFFLFLTSINNCVLSILDYVLELSQSLRKICSKFDRVQKCVKLFYFKLS